MSSVSASPSTVRVVLSNLDDDKRKNHDGYRRHKFALLFSNKAACLEFVDVEEDSGDRVQEFLGAYGDMSFNDDAFYDACLAALHVFVSVPTDETHAKKVRFGFLRKAGDDCQGWPCVVCDDWEHVTRFVCNYPYAEFNLQQIVDELRKKLLSEDKVGGCALRLTHKVDGPSLDIISGATADIPTDTMEQHGRVPLHVAMECGLSPAALSTMINIVGDKKTCSIRDPNTGLYPFQAIASTCASVSENQQSIWLDLVYRLFRDQDPSRAIRLHECRN